MPLPVCWALSSINQWQSTQLPNCAAQTHLHTHTHTNPHSHSISQWNCNSLWPGMQCRPQVSEVTFALDRTDQNVINIDAFCQQAGGSVECGKARRWTEQLPPRVWHGLLKRKRLFTMCNKLALLGDAQSPILAWPGLDSVCKPSGKQTTSGQQQQQQQDEANVYGLN